MKEDHEGIRNRVEKTTGWKTTDRRIRSLSYVHDGVSMEDTVGEKQGDNVELIAAIFETKVSCQPVYFVCTTNRGVLGGEPILVGENEVIEIKDFDAN